MPLKRKRLSIQVQIWPLAMYDLLIATAKAATILEKENISSNVRIGEEGEESCAENDVS
jgi:hypothetical protein